jgi:uncharacterized damage-inducible protein DinB
MPEARCPEGIYLLGMTHPSPPVQGDERATLTAFLDYYRALIVDKASGLSQEQANRALPPSSLTLAGIVHHLAVVEHWWFHEFFTGADRLEPWASVDWEADWDWDFHVAPELELQVILDRYADACARSRRVTDAAGSLDQLSERTDRDGRHRSLRWILVHMIEEVARHAGHADLIRESIDGATGDFREAAPDTS